MSSHNLRLCLVGLLVLGFSPAWAQSANVAVIYATGSKEIRRIVLPDNDSELNDPALVGKGESMLVVARKTITAPGDAELAVLAKTGIAPPDPASAVVDAQGNVVGLIAADPAVDVLLDKTVSLVGEAQGVAVGDTYNKVTGKFINALRVEIVPPIDVTSPVLMNVLSK